MSYLKKTFKIKARDFSHGGSGSIRIQGILKKIGFDFDIIRRVSICSYESEMNVVMHGGNGALSVEVSPENIILHINDDGKGIEDIELALQEGYSTSTEEDREMGFGAGMGLPNIKRHSDSLDISSQKGTGTSLKITFKVGTK